MKKDKTILYVGLGLAALLALRYFSKKRTQAGGTANNNEPYKPFMPVAIDSSLPIEIQRELMEYNRRQGR